MASQGTVLEDLSQPISESYIHLSQDNDSELSNTSSIDFDHRSLSEPQTTHSEYGYQNLPDTSVLLRLAQEIDRHTEKDDQSESNNTNYKSKGTDINEGSNDTPYTKDSRPELKAPHKGVLSPPSPTNNIKKSSPMISSHSTPLMPRKTMAGNNFKWSKSKDNNLPDINESKDDTTVNEIVRPASSHSRNLSKHSRMNSYNRTDIDEDTFLPQHQHQHQQSKFSLEEFFESVLPLFSEQISEKIEKSLKELIIQKKSRQGSRDTHTDTQTRPRHQKTKSHDIFITPIRSHTESIKSTESEDEDDLSLTGIHTGPSHERKKFSVNYDGSIAVQEDKEGDEHNPDADSPITTPPYSQEYTDSKSQGPSFFSEDHRQELPETQKLQQQIEQLKAENLDLKIEVGDLQVKVAEKDNQLAKHNLEIDTDLSEKPREVYESEEYRKLQETLERTNIELQRVRLEKQELANEYDWYRHNKGSGCDMGVQAVAEEDNKILRQEQEINNLHSLVESYVAEIAQLQSKILLQQKELGDGTIIDAESIDEKFRGQYEKLQLDKVDKMSRVEMSNLIKNLMLSLLISDFDNLPVNAAKYGRYLRLSMRFMDDMHRILYVAQGVKPSDYLYRKGNIEQMLNLQECLEGMTRLVKDCIHIE